MARIEEKSVASWAALRELIGSVVVSGVDGSPVRDLLFRGQRDSTWKLVSSFDRAHTTMPLDDRVQLHGAMIQSFRERGVAADRGLSSSSDDELLVTLQQHGAPTRLLDWSQSPYVASYFAFTGAMSSDPSGDACLIVLNTRSSMWRAGIGVRLIRSAGTSDARVLNQRGDFTLMETTHDSLEQLLAAYETTPKKNDDVAPLKKWVFPAEEAHAALRDLELMGISSETMFPGLDGASRYAYFRALMQFG